MSRMMTILGLLCVISTAQAGHNTAANRCFQAKLDSWYGKTISLPSHVDTNEEFKRFIEAMSSGMVTMKQDICVEEINKGVKAEGSSTVFLWEDGRCVEAVSKQWTDINNCSY